MAQCTTGNEVDPLSPLLCRCQTLSWLTHEQVEEDVSDDDIERAEIKERSGHVATVRLPVVVADPAAVGRADLLPRRLGLTKENINNNNNNNQF